MHRIFSLLLFTGLAQDMYLYDQYSYMFSCIRHNCPNEQTACFTDSGCSSTLQQCSDGCRNNEDSVKCFQSCLQSSNSLFAQNLFSCTNKNKCFQKPKLRETNCEEYCLGPLLSVKNQCTNGKGFVDLICSIEKMSDTDPQCASKDCICGLQLQIGQYIPGC